MFIRYAHPPMKCIIQFSHIISHDSSWNHRQFTKEISVFTMTNKLYKYYRY